MNSVNANAGYTTRDSSTAKDIIQRNKTRVFCRKHNRKVIRLAEAEARYIERAREEENMPNLSLLDILHKEKINDVSETPILLPPVRVAKKSI